MSDDDVDPVDGHANRQRPLDVRSGVDVVGVAGALAPYGGSLQLKGQH